MSNEEYDARQLAKLKWQNSSRQADAIMYDNRALNVSVIMAASAYIEHLEHALGKIETKILECKSDV